MPRTTRILLFIVLITAVFIGGSQLSSNSDVFAGAMLRCCNNGMCHEASCSTGSSILPCSGSEYSTTCLWCMDMISTLDACGLYLGPETTWCVFSDGTKFYADPL